MRNFKIILIVLSFTLVLVSGFADSLTNSNGKAYAHRSGCHRYHSCPSDSGSYVCGDLGYDSQCPNKQSKSTPQTKSKSNNNNGNSADESNKITKTCIEGYHLNRKGTKCLLDKKEQTASIGLVANNLKNTNLTLSSIKCQGLADCFEGTVTEVVDGDTLDVNNVRIRLALVNTLEVDELGFSDAKHFTESTCRVGTHAKVDEDDGQKGGSFGRMIGLVYCGNNPVSFYEALLNSSQANLLQKFCCVSEFASSGWAIKYGC